MSLPRGKDLTNLMNEAPPQRQRTTPPVRQEMYYGGYGRWRTVFKVVGRPQKEVFTEQRPEVKNNGSVVHIHSDRFDWIVGFDKIEALEIEFGDLPPEQKELEPIEAVSIEEFEKREREELLAEEAE